MIAGALDPDVRGHPWREPGEAPRPRAPDPARPVPRRARTYEERQALKAYVRVCIINRPRDALPVVADEIDGLPEEDVVELATLRVHHIGGEWDDFRIHTMERMRSFVKFGFVDA